MRQYKPTPFLYTRTANTDNHEANSNYEDSNLLDLEVEVLKQRIDGNIKRHMDIRSEIRMEVDKLRQENMDLAAMLHRTDEIFYLHQDFFEEVNRLRSMNVRLKAMMCLQDVKSIEAFGPTKSRRGYQSNVQQPTNPNCPASSHSTERDTRAETSDKSSDLFDRIDKLEAEMRTFLGETPSHKKIEICQRKHVSDIDMHRITRNIRDHSLDDNLIFIRRRDTKSDQTNSCDASTSTEVQLEAENYGYVDEPQTRSTFWTKDRDLHSHKTYTSMTILRSKAESASSDDKDVNMNSSRSDDRSILLNNSNAITKSCSRSKDENVISEDRDINMNSHRSNDEWVLPDHTIINSSNNSECLLLMVHPKRSQSGTIVGFEVAENFEGTSIDKDKPVHHEVKRTHCEPTQPVFQKGVTSDLVPSYVDIPGSIEDLEIRDLFKNASNESDSDHSTTSSERPLKLSTPFTVVSTRHVRPRDVPRLNLGDLVSESDINIVRVTQDTVDDLLYDEEDRYSSVSFIDISDGSGRQRLGKEDMSVADLQINQFGRYYNEESHFINDVTNVTGESCFTDDHHTRSDNPKNFSNRRSNLSNMIKKLCANKEMSYMQEFFSDVSADNKTVCPEADVRTSESIREESTQTIIGENTTWNNTFNGNSKLSAPTFQTELEEETPWVNLNDVNRSSVDISEDSVSVIPTDSDEDRYVHYMELCNTTMHLTGIIQDMCVNRTILTQQEFLQHTNPTEKPCPPEIWDGKDYVIENNIMRIPVKSESTNPHAKPDCLTKHCLTGLSSPSYTDIVKLVQENFPWTFPRAEEKNNNGIKECVKDYNSTLNVTIPCCTMDSVRSDVSCIDLSCEEETPNLGSTRKEPAVKACFICRESPIDGIAECVTDRSDVSGDTIYTDRYVVPGELALSCQKRQLLSTSLSESHEDVVRLLNWTNVSHTKAHWEDPEHEAILKETSEREILNSPDSFVGDFAYKQKWKPCFTSENIPKANEETNPTLTSDYTNMGSARSGYDVEAEISCIDLSEETTTTSSVQNCHTVKEFLRYDGDKLDTREVFYRDLSPCWSTSATSYDETTYSADTEETDNLYVTASEDDSELRGLASPVSLAGYARRDQIWEEDFVINYMTRATKEKIDKEYTKLLITQANEDIDKIHEIRIPVLLEEECLLESNDSLTDEPKTRVITEAMDSARSDVSCIELSKEEPTLRDIGEGHVVKEFLVRDEDNQGISNVISDTEESDQWAVPTKHVTFELAESGSSSADDQVILSDIENDDDRSDITGNDVTSVQAFSDGDSCVFDVDDQDVCLKKQDETGQSDPRPPDVQVASNTTPVLPFDDTNLNLDFVPRMSKLKKQGPRMGFKFLRRLNLKLAKVKQDLMTSSRLSKWLMP